MISIYSSNRGTTTSIFSLHAHFNANGVLPLFFSYLLNNNTVPLTPCITVTVRLPVTTPVIHSEVQINTLDTARYEHTVYSHRTHRNTTSGFLREQDAIRKDVHIIHTVTKEPASHRVAGGVRSCTVACGRRSAGRGNHPSESRERPLNCGYGTSDGTCQVGVIKGVVMVSDHW